MNYTVIASSGLVIVAVSSDIGVAKDRCNHSPATNLTAYCNLQAQGYCDPKTGYTTINASNSQQVAIKNDCVWRHSRGKGAR
jgi:hypothetical protein